MDEVFQPTAVSKIKKPRSRIACKRCHDRRVRCDAATTGVPCSGCVAVNLGDVCHLLNSRRTRGNNGRFASRNSLQTPTITEPQSPAPVPRGEAASTPTPQTSSGGGRIPVESYGENMEAWDRDSAVSKQESIGEADVWSKVVSHDYPLASDGRRVLYVGEPWTLAYVMRWKGRGSQSFGSENASPRTMGESPRCIHFPMPMDDSVSPPDGRRASIAIETTSNRLVLSNAVQEALLESYFRRNHRLYPVLDQREFENAFRCRTVPTALLLSVLYAAVLHAPDVIIYRAGFDSRQSLLLRLYCQAKTAYFAQDDDGSVDQLTYVQSAFLLHNMWQGPNASMDPWTWLGLAIRMAQNIGMHRSTEQSSLSKREQRLWKRIWWCLHMRDRQIASALGKPLMIRDEDCDVGPLTADDFEDDDSEEMRDFVMQQAKLGTLFGVAISALFTACPRDPVQKNIDRTSLLKDLEEWGNELPASVRCPDTRSLDVAPFPALLLEVLSNCLLLLIHRSSQFDPNCFPEEHSATWKPAFDAARAITRVTEAIMNHGSLTDCPLFFTSALFGAMTVHAIRGPEAEQQLSLCMIAMRSLSTMYFAAGWIRNLFQKLTYRRAISARPSKPPSPSPEQTRFGERAQPSENANPKPPNDAPQPSTEICEEPMMTYSECLGAEHDLPSSEVGTILETHHLPPEAWHGSFSSAGAFGLGNTNFGGFLDYSSITDGNAEFSLADIWQEMLGPNAMHHPI